MSVIWGVLAVGLWVVGCDDPASGGDAALPPPQFVDMGRPLPDGGGVDASPYFQLGPALPPRCEQMAGGQPIVDPQPETFTFFEPPFYVRVVHLQNYGDGPLIIDDMWLDASAAFALYAAPPGHEQSLVMTGGVPYVEFPLCIPPGESLMVFVNVNSIPGPLEDGWVFLETNRPAAPTLCLPIWFGRNEQHDDCP